MAEPEAPMRNPFRNEADAFRILVMFMVAAAAVIAATVLVGGWLGAIVALVAIGAGIYAAVGWLRVGLGEREEPDGPEAPPGGGALPVVRRRGESGSDAPDETP